MRFTPNTLYTKNVSTRKTSTPKNLLHFHTFRPNNFYTRTSVGLFLSQTILSRGTAIAWSHFFMASKPTEEPAKRFTLVYALETLAEQTTKLDDVGGFYGCDVDVDAISSTVPNQQIRAKSCFWRGTSR